MNKIIAVLALALSTLLLAQGNPSGGKVFEPKQYGAKCDNSTDNTLAFGRMATAINTAGGGAVEFQADCIYRVLSNISLIGRTVLTITGVTRLDVRCNGATIHSPYTWPTPDSVGSYIWGITNSSNVTFTDCKFSMLPMSPTLQNDRGIHAINFGIGVHNVILRNTTVTNGVSAVSCSRDYPYAARSDNFLIENLYTTNVYYVLNPERCPDNLTARNVRTINPGRSYFPYGVSNHDVQVFSDAVNGPQDIYIATAYDVRNTEPNGNDTRNIKVQYTNTNLTAGDGTPPGPNTFVQIQQGYYTTAFFTGTISGTTLTVNPVGYSGSIIPGLVLSGAGITVGTTIVSGAGLSWIISAPFTLGPEAMTTQSQGPSTIDNIKIHATVVRGDNPNNSTLLRVTRTAGSIAAGRTISNVEFSGSYQTNATSPLIFDLMYDSDWTGDNVQNFTIRDFKCSSFSGGVSRVDGRGITGPFRLENLLSNATCAFATRDNMATPNAAGFLSYNQVFMPTAITPP